MPAKKEAKKDIKPAAKPVEEKTEVEDKTEVVQVDNPPLQDLNKAAIKNFNRIKYGEDE